MDHYAEAFQAQPGRCWRMVTAPDGTGHPMFCPEPAVWRARTQITRGVNRGKWYVVDSCDRHTDDELVKLLGTSHPARH